MIAGGPQAEPADDRTERSVRQALTVDPRRATGPQGGRHHHPGVSFTRKPTGTSSL